MTDIRKAGVIWLGTEPKPELDSAQACQGTRVLSLRTLLMRFVRTYIGANTAQNGLIFRTSTVGYVTVAGGVEKLGDFCGDVWSAIVSCYAFQRGGVKVLTRGQFGTNAQFCAHLIQPVANPVAVYTPTTPLNIPSQLAGCYVSQGNTGAPTIILKDPCYQCVPARLTRLGSATTPEPLDYFAPQCSLAVHSTSTATGYSLWRAAAEDFQVGFFVGPPTWTTNASL